MHCDIEIRKYDKKVKRNKGEEEEQNKVESHHNCIAYCCSFESNRPEPPIYFGNMSIS